MHGEAEFVDQGRGRPPRYEGADPYALRGSFVSLLVWEGRTMLEVAAQAGTASTCARCPTRGSSRGYDPAHRTSAEAAILAARRTEGRPTDAISGRPARE